MQDKTPKVALIKPFSPVILWALVILLLSAGDSIQMPEAWISPDKAGHLIAYAILNGLVLQALHQTARYTLRSGGIATMASCMYGVAMELM